MGASDSFVWRHTKDGIYSIKSSYIIAASLLDPRRPIPLGLNLQSRGLPNNNSCQHCGDQNQQSHVSSLPSLDDDIVSTNDVLHLDAALTFGFTLTGLPLTSTTINKLLFENRSFSFDKIITSFEIPENGRMHNH
ncbi:hypothetical protein HID58_055820 [Brassica napus]|uniref:Uncharacterized protein n=1 Tax=Brassica napus TaxID=3708 RepID=A0ABQ8AMR2_BRANA|nr:hypothetical protein HID58_055820 [Brassica napus]